MRKKILQFGRKHGTLMWLLEYKQTKEIENVYVQFSLKDPWWIPKYDQNFAEGTMPLFGWMFFYFGRNKYGQMMET